MIIIIIIIIVVIVWGIVGTLLLGAPPKHWVICMVRYMYYG